MSSEILNLTAQIVISHASTKALTPRELVAEIKAIHGVLVALERETGMPEPKPILQKPKVSRQRKPRKVKMEESPEARAVQDQEKLPIGDPDYMEFMESREG